MLTRNQIPQMTQRPAYYVNVDLEGLVAALDRYKARYEFDMNPPFQRGRVWTQIKKVRWIEYLLRGGSQQHGILFNHPDFQSSTTTPGAKMECIDGQQRLAAILDFLAGDFPVFAGLNGKAEGYFVSEIDEIALRRAQVTIFINNLKHRDEIAKWYLELNEGHTAHTEAELDLAREYYRTEHSKRYGALA